MELKHRLLDVFTERPFGGNQLAVFPGADGLDARDMQRIAGELALSETAFVLPSRRPDAAWRLRIHGSSFLCRPSHDRGGSAPGRPGDGAARCRCGAVRARRGSRPGAGARPHWQHDTFLARWRDRELRADAYITFALEPDGSIDQARCCRRIPRAERVRQGARGKTVMASRTARSAHFMTAVVPAAEISGKLQVSTSASGASRAATGKRICPGRSRGRLV